VYWEFIKKTAVLTKEVSDGTLVKMRIFLAALLAAGPAYAAQRRTDLGEAGNRAVAAAFEAYKAAHAGGACHASGGGKRVLITGFGPFGGDSNNMSGSLVASVADEGVLPGPIDTARPPTPLAGPPKKGKITAADSGGRARNRTLRIDGTDYDLCVLVLDVKWDLGAAITLFEAASFHPDFILMTGAGEQPTFEVSAVNRAWSLPGADSEGRDLGPTGIKHPTEEQIAAASAASGETDNLPRSETVDPDAAQGARIPMAWDAGALARAVGPAVTALGYTAGADDTPKNNYVCNNISYIVLKSLRGEAVRLAGGLIVIPGGRPRATKAGFFHLPDALASYHSMDEYRAGVAAWARVLALVVKTGLAG
jgi:pyrrolidone-carboxylate peptidase